MALKIGQFAQTMINFITKSDKTIVQNNDQAIAAYCNALENSTYAAIKSAKITIPIGALSLTNGAITVTNIQPIVIEQTLS